MRVRASCKPGESFSRIIFMEHIPKQVRTLYRADKKTHAQV